MPFIGQEKARLPVSTALSVHPWALAGTVNSTACGPSVRPLRTWECRAARRSGRQAKDSAATARARSSCPLASLPARRRFITPPPGSRRSRRSFRRRSLVPALLCQPTSCNPCQIDAHTTRFQALATLWRQRPAVAFGTYPAPTQPRHPILLMPKCRQGVPDSDPHDIGRCLGVSGEELLEIRIHMLALPAIGSHAPPPIDCSGDGGQFHLPEGFCLFRPRLCVPDERFGLGGRLSSTPACGPSPGSAHRALPQ